MENMKFKQPLNFLKAMCITFRLKLENKIEGFFSLKKKMEGILFPTSFIYFLSFLKIIINCNGGLRLRG